MKIDNSLVAVVLDVSAFNDVVIEWMTEPRDIAGLRELIVGLPGIDPEATPEAWMNMHAEYSRLFGCYSADADSLTWRETRRRRLVSLDAQHRGRRYA